MVSQIGAQGAFMAIKINSKIDKSILIPEGISVEQNLLDALFLGESREHALVKAENIIECLIHDYGGHYDFINQLDAVIKKNPIGALTLFAILIKHTENEFSIRAQISANKWHENNPKRKDKEFIFECWQEWCNKPSQYKSKADFSRSMLDKCEHLTSQKKIEDWCREWEKSHLAR